MSSHRGAPARLMGLVGSGMVAAFVLSAGACNNFDRVPIPPPEELGAPSFPEGATVGGLDATFAQLFDDTDGERCGAILRFEPDGTAVWSTWGCPDEGETFERFAERRLEDSTASRGDYAIIGQHVWMRLVYREFPEQVMELELVEAEVCGDRLMTHRPDTQYRAWTTRVSADYEFVSGTAPATSDRCDVPRFSIDRRSAVHLTGRSAGYTVVTDPGRTCSLAYVGPDGVRVPDEGSLDVVAGADGVCVLEFPVGDDPGEGVATVTVGGFARQFLLDVR